MATPVWCCGGECGLTAHWTLTSTPTINTATPLNGLRSFEFVRAGVPIGLVSIATFSSGTGITVFRGTIQFPTTLPDGNCSLFGVNVGGTVVGARFIASGATIRSAIGTTVPGSGVAITTGVTYEIDVIADTSANPWTCDVQVNGVACPQITSGVAANTTARALNCGIFNAAPTTGTMLADNFVVSETAGDYPLGALVVHGRVATADGTHNIAGTGDFQRGNTGTDILNATTTAWQLIDDVPLPSGAVDESDNWRAVAPPNATDYPESVFGAITGDSSTPSTAPVGVEAIAIHHQIATGAGSSEALLNDNGTTGTIFSLVAAAGVTTYRTARAHFATPPTGGAWVRGGGGNGDFDDLRVRFRCADANPDQCLDAVMLEAAFPPANPTADLDATFGAMTVSASASAAVVAALAITFGAVTSAATASAAAVADASPTFGAMALDSQASIFLPADLDITFGDMTMSATAAASVQAAGLAPMGALTVASEAASAVQADASLTFGALTLSADASVATVADGLSTLGAMITSAATAVAAVADLDVTFGPLTVDADAQNVNAAELETTFGAMSVASQATAAVQADGLAPLGAMAVSTDANASAQADMSANLGAVTLNASASASATADGLTSFGPLSTSATAGASVTADLSALFGSMSVTAQASSSVGADLSASFGPMSLSATAVSREDFQADLNVTFGALTLDAQSSVSILADLDITFRGMSTTSGAVVTGPVWPAICRTSVIGPTGPVHSISAIEPVYTVTEGEPVYEVSEAGVIHDVSDMSPVHTVSLACE